jgi:Ca-activated chloride channel homolog
MVYAQPLFRSAVDLVTVPVTVTAKDTLRRVGELGTADFRIYEDDVPQQLAVVSHEPRELSVCILVDSSPSMASGRQPLAMRAIDALMKGLKEDDEASVHFFAARIRTVMPWTRGSDITPISWLEWRLSLGTALIDALKEGLAQVERANNPLPVILVVSDGGENVSGTSLPKLVETRRQSETLIYGIHTDLAPSRYAPLVNRAFANFLPQVVGDSGGMIHRVRTVEEAETAAEALLEELRSQYTLGYSPKRALDGKYRKLRIETVDQNLITRHRAGYLATPQK